MNIGCRIKKIAFLGNGHCSKIIFDNPVHIVHGASNTGKSLLIEAIDYMFGAEKLKPVLPESKNYKQVVMQVTLNGEEFTIFREWPSIKFEIYNGHIDTKIDSDFYGYFKHGQATNNVANISDFYLKGIRGAKVLSNLHGEKSSLTIRLLSRIILSSEEKIISTASPIVVGDRTEDTTNKNVFKFLLTGVDDSEIKLIVRKKEFTSENKGQKEALSYVIDSFKLDLIFPEENGDSLHERDKKLTISIDGLLEKIGYSQEALSEVVSEKKIISCELMDTSNRIDVIKVNLANFKTLNSIYSCDIDRLNSQEEAAFLLSVGHSGQCDFCGETPKTVCNQLTNVKNLAQASLAEIEKIKSKKSELELTTHDLEKQLNILIAQHETLKKKLEHLDVETERRVPDLISEDSSLATLRKEKSSVQQDLCVHEKINAFNKRLQEIELTPVPKPYKSKDFYPEDESISDFCSIYSKILSEIKFPGEHKVDFDFKTFDVIIDDVPRHLNGKGVRAILHSVFKVALLMHCRSKGLYHPGIVILDSPLVTYRDPLNSKLGKLSTDEKELAQTKISYHFLNFLYKIRDQGQFIIVENIDIPTSFKDSIGIDTFYGKNATVGQRKGLL
ncbi:hypothetical protein [Enterovibrio norvegicus]|uniref:hypothetical protein n=1 Tax=Enterovibrio norvegicus TaxID=188144 RepID=UPI0002EE9E7E|nr:hypothetical protein [Enterovibrio norvegicus]OEF57939.1 hypothetical protein A1OU_06960 [Enterovibrio norvegicus]